MLGMGFLQDWTSLLGLRLVLGIFEVCLTTILQNVLCADLILGWLLSRCRLPALNVVYTVRGWQAICVLLPHWLRRLSLWRNSGFRFDANGGYRRYEPLAEFQVENWLIILNRLWRMEMDLHHRRPRKSIGNVTSFDADRNIAHRRDCWARVLVSTLIPRQREVQVSEVPYRGRATLRHCPCQPRPRRCRR